MRKKQIFKKIIALLLILSASCFAFSCKTDSEKFTDEEFLSGVEYGKTEMFLSLLNAIAMNDEKQLSSGKKWKTDDFTLTSHKDSMSSFLLPW